MGRPTTRTSSGPISAIGSVKSMCRKHLAARALGVPALAVAAAAAYALVLRPWHLRWGATHTEVARRWPGDELVVEPSIRAVRAVTVQAPPSKVWPWVMQIGRERGGFYSYSWLENLIGADIRNVHRLIPGLPDRQVGDTVWMAPRDRFGGDARMIVAHVQFQRALVLVPATDGEGARAATGVWSFILEPSSDHTTRLVMLSLTATPRLADRLFWEPAHFVMERRMMLTIKRLAEQVGPDF
jgi:hypothetical protein